MITRIEAYNYRCFRRLSVGLDGFKVFAGKNGAGKSTLLDLPALFADLVRTGETDGAFFETTGSSVAPRAFQPRELVHNHDGDYFSLAVEARLPEDVQLTVANALPARKRDDPRRHPSILRYEIRFEVFNDRQLQVAGEYLMLFPEVKGAVLPKFGEVQSITDTRPLWGDGLVGESEAFEKMRSKPWYPIIVRKPGGPAEVRTAGKPKPQFAFSLAPNRIALANVPADAGMFPAVLWFRDFLLDHVRQYNPSPSHLRLPSYSGSRVELAGNAANLPWLLRELYQANQRQFNNWNRHVGRALEGVDKVRVYTVEPGDYASLQIAYDGGLVVNASGLSYGTLRVLSLTAPPYLLTPPTLLMVEEPEDGLHPLAIEVVLEALRMNKRSHTWVTTHSPVVLANTQLDEIVVLRRTENGSEAVLGPQIEGLSAWQDRLNLGELYAMGVLG